MNLVNWFYIFLCIFTTEAARLHLHEATIGPITEEESAFLTLSLENNVEYPWKEARLKTLSITPKQISVENDTFFFTEDEIEAGRNVTIKIHALVLGHGKIIIQVFGIANNTNETTEYLERIVKASVAKKERVIDQIFVIGLAIFMIIININMSCAMDLNVIKQVFHKPTGPIIVLCIQFLFTPLLAYGLIYAFLTSSIMRLGIFVIGCCPAGYGSNFWTLLFDGDLNLSVVMTFVSTIVTIGMMPLWLFTLGRDFYDASQVPYIHLIITVASLILPVGAGLLIRHFRPSWAKFSQKIVRPFTVIMLLFFITVGAWANLFLAKLFTLEVVTAGITLALSECLFGALAAWLICMEKEQLIAMTIETAFQNSGIGFLVLKLSLPQPDADLASLPFVAKLLVTGLPYGIAYIVVCSRRRQRAPPEPSKENCFRKVFAKKKMDETDVEELQEQTIPNPGLWIPVPEIDDHEQDGMIRTYGDGEEDIVWER